MTQQVELEPKKVFGCLSCVVGALVTIHVAILIARVGYGHERLLGFRMLFDLDEEHNIPTLYSAMALMSCAAVLAMIAVLHRKRGEGHLHWWGLGAVFALISIDEIVQLHETIAPDRMGENDQLLVSGWVAPYLTAAVLLGLAYIPFLLRLSKRHRLWFMGAGAIFVTGAAGFEVLAPIMEARFGQVGYAVCYTCEETMEMVGVIVFLYGLLDYAASQFGSPALVVHKKS